MDGWMEHFVRLLVEFFKCLKQVFFWRDVRISKPLFIGLLCWLSKLNFNFNFRKIEFKDSDEDEDDDEEKVAESSTSKSASKNKIEISKSLKTIILSKTQTAAVKLTAKTIQKNLALPIPKTPKMSRNEIEKSSNRRNKKTDSSGRTKKHAASRTRRRQTLSTTTSDEESSDTSQPKPGTVQRRFE
jgi:hypothetical protein